MDARQILMCVVSFLIATEEQDNQEIDAMFDVLSAASVNSKHEYQTAIEYIQEQVSYLGQAPEKEN